MSGQIQFRNEDLVLQVNKNVDPATFNIDDYEAFIGYYSFEGITAEYFKDIQLCLS